MRALLIDDSLAMRNYLGAMLEQLGFEVLKAVHGKDGLEQLHQHGTPDVALVDWNMPEMNGLEFVQSVRQDDQYSTLRLLMVTSETELEAMAIAIEAGADEYVMKPFTIEELTEKLKMTGVLAR
jgi:two-component system, chemotaxis family, chemotaxis protein CheY